MRWLRTSRPLTLLLLATLVAGHFLLAHAPAEANPWQRVDCDQRPTHPECELEAGVGPSGVMSIAASGEVVCRLGGEVVPCVTDEGWLGADGCRYLRLEGESPPVEVSEPGAVYRVRCPGDPPNSQRALVWMSDAEAPGPAELGRIAASRLVLPRPQVVVNPPASAPQLVMLPTWLWAEAAWWQVPRSASASVPGVTVTATATPLRVVWSMGDGTTVTCQGPGTPYSADVGDPAAASPDCGHTYTRTSAGEPGGVFDVSATVTWQVSWSGGGASGQAGPLFSTATVPVTVVEVRSVNTGGGR
jgi:hypothetical protein